jgi:peptide/nickel transport system substrate-binding protein
MVVVEDANWYPLVLNHSKAPTNNLKFRQAIQAALDVRAIGLAMTNGKSEFFRVQPSLWYPVSPYHTDIRGELYNQANLDKAKALLAESGYAGEEVVFITNRNFERMYRVAVATQDQLQKGLGVNVKLEVMDWPSQTKRRDEQPDSWHINSTSYVSEGLFSPDSYAAYWRTGSKNTFASIPELDALFSKGLEATTMEQRKEVFTEVQRIFHEQVVSVKTVDGFALTGIKANVQGYRPWYNPTRFWGCWRG